LIAALDANLIACREVAKHFKCPYGTGASITPDGVIVVADGTVLVLDVVVVGTGDKAQEAARRKRFGWGSLGALERAEEGAGGNMGPGAPRGGGWEHGAEGGRGGEAEGGGARAAGIRIGAGR
jgi:hypothetical protein